jgi:hypothetical protein
MRSVKRTIWLCALFIGMFLLLSFKTYANDTISIASFNLRVFGTTKAKNTAVLNEIASILRNFDIIAVQELRDASETAAQDLLAALNANKDYNYAMLLSPRLGRTNSKEQYAFFYRTSSVACQRRFKPAGFRRREIAGFSSFMISRNQRFRFVVALSFGMTQPSG